MSSKRPKAPKKPAASRQCLLVLGMHRSGTSVLAQLLSLAGATLPKRLIGATKDNEFGHFEPVVLNDRNDLLLQQLGSSWQDWARLDLGAAPSDVMAHYVSDVRSFIGDELGNAPLTVVKEPRSCRLLPPLLRAFDAEHITTLAIIPFRNPLEVASSLAARDGLSLREGVLLWLRHFLDAERDSRGLRRSFISYESLFSDWQAQFQRMGKDLGLEWPNDLATGAKDFDGAIVSGARHNRWTDDDLAQTAYTRGLATRVNRACEKLVHAPNDAATLAELDAIGAQFDELVELTLPPYVAARKALASASTEASAQKAVADELKRKNIELEHGLKGIWQLHDVVSDLNKKNEQYIGDIRSQLGEKQRQLQAARESLAEIQQRLQSERQALNAELQSERQQLQQSQRENAELGHQRAQSEAMAAQMQQDIKALEHQSREISDKLAGKAQELAQVNQTLEAKRVESGHYAQGVKDKTAEIENLANMLREIYASRSWKITAPVRLFGRGVRKVQRKLRRLVASVAMVFWRMLPVSKRIQLKNRIMSSNMGRKLLGSTSLYQQWQHLQIVRFEKPAPVAAKPSARGRFDAVDAPAPEVTGAQTDWVEVDTADHFVPRRVQVDLKDPQARLITFYLPQFHAFAENDEWWGKGFTEWTNVRPAKPMFPGHYQPHEPLDIGYYDLTDIEAQKKQIELAKLYGIGGFCFYWYWFDGKRLMEKPVEQWLAHPELDMPFCICWANENWTRRWDGKDSEVLIGQNHSPEDDLAFIADLAPYLNDSRYIRINGKPLVLVYRPRLLPDPQATAERWRVWCRENGVGEIYLAYTQSFESEDPHRYGFDAAIEFPPNNASPTVLTDKIKDVDPDFTGIIYDWNSYVDRSRDYPQPDYRLIRSVCPAWDNTARRKKGGAIFLNNTPEEYGTWLGNALTRTMLEAPTPDDRIIFCNAWNEWAEGAHLEPDSKFGYAWLETTRDALDPHARPRHITLIGHDAHPHGAQILLLNLARAYHQAGLQVKVVLLTGGDLVKDYAEVAQVVQLPDPIRQRDEAMRQLRGLRNEHAEVAIVNTSVSGSVAPLLHEAGYSPATLVHEMRSVFAQMDLTRQIQDIGDTDLPVIFPAKVVRDQFEAKLGRRLNNAVIRPQGMYLRPADHDPSQRDTLRESYGIDKDAPLLLGSGYIDYRKGADLFVQVIAALRGKGVPAEAIWIGHADRDFIRTVEALAKKLGVSEYVRFPGRQADPAPFYAAADVFLLTSREDPYPSVVLEAMAADVPVIMFEGTTGSQDLADRRLATAVEAEKPEAMADAAMRIMSEAVNRDEMVARAAEFITNETSFTEYALDLLKLAGRPAPRISVIIPSYNYQDYIRDRIESVIAQDMPILEIIILDDCSTDKSPEIIADLVKSSRAPIRFVANEENSGNVFRQWQKGLSLARGDYIWIAEADDLSAPDFLSTVMRGFEIEGVVLSYCESAQIDGDGNPLAKDYRYYTDPIAPGKWDQNYVANGKSEIKDALYLKNTILNASAVVMQADALQEVFAQSSDEIQRLRFAGDWAVYLNLLGKGNVAYSALSKNYHRRHQSSVTMSNFNTSQLEEIRMMQEKAQNIIGASVDRQTRVSEYITELEQQFGIKQRRVKVSS